MGLLKNLHRFFKTSQDDTIRQYVAFELSIEYKLEKSIPLDVNEEAFYFSRRKDIAQKLGITREQYQRLRTEMKDNWQHILHRH